MHHSVYPHSGVGKGDVKMHGKGRNPAKRERKRSKKVQ